MQRDPVEDSQPEDQTGLDSNRDHFLFGDPVAWGHMLKITLGSEKGHEGRDYTTVETWHLPSTSSIEHCGVTQHRDGSVNR